jgi:hypothetical protein
MKQKIGKTRACIIGWLLHNANSSPPVFTRKEFYAMKQAILERYATPGSPEFQHFEKKECFHCWSYHHCYDCDDYGKCCRCDGTGVFLPEAWVRLIPWTLGGYNFHSPAEKHLQLPEGHVAKYEGKIIHGLKPYHLPEECDMWLSLFFDRTRFFRDLGRNAFYGKLSFKRPLVSLGTIVHMFCFDRWHLYRRVLPYKVYMWLRYRHEIKQDAGIPF